jgi:hypothetical protein
MKSRTCCALLTCLTLAITASGEVTDMALDHSGTLYRVTSKDGSLVLTISAPKSVTTIVPIPGVLADEITNPLVTYDEVSQTVVLAWQENYGDFLRRVELATYQNGTWFGPVKIAGDDAFWATNPTLLVQRAVTIDEAGDELATNFIHLGWWDGENDDDGGNAKVSSIPLENGVPLLDEKVTVVLRDLVPYGIACNVGLDSSLSRPRLFLDPQTNTVHMLFIDVVDCRFVISQHEVRLSEEGESVEKRRRCISSWRVRFEVAVKPQITMANSKFNVGHNMSVVMYWDEESAVNYATLNPDDGWSDIKSLKLDEHLDHEHAVELIRHLANKQ